MVVNLKWFKVLYACNVLISQEIFQKLSEKEKSKKINKNSSSSNFFALVSIVFTIARLMVHFKQFNRALKYSQAMISIGALYFDPTSLDICKKSVNVYVKYSAFLIWRGSKSKTDETSSLWDSKSYLKVGQELRDVRRFICSSKFLKEFPGK